MSQAAMPRRVTFGDVLANREFRAMFAAQALSVVGDQLARIAVAILVFQRSHSALLTGVSYGISYAVFCLKKKKQAPMPLNQTHPPSCPSLRLPAHPPATVASHYAQLPHFSHPPALP